MVLLQESEIGVQLDHNINQGDNFLHDFTFNVVDGDRGAISGDNLRYSTCNAGASICWRPDASHLTVSMSGWPQGLEQWTSCFFDKKVLRLFGPCARKLHRRKCCGRHKGSFHFWSLQILLHYLSLSPTVKSKKSSFRVVLSWQQRKKIRWILSVLHHHQIYDDGVSFCKIFILLHYLLGRHKWFLRWAITQKVKHVFSCRRGCQEWR